MNNKTTKKYIDWNDFDEISEMTKKYLPLEGEGETMATQAVTAISKLVYRWFNDGDTYDNRYGLDSANDLSTYANWLYNKLSLTKLAEIKNICHEQHYTDLLYHVAIQFTPQYLEKLNQNPKVDSIYTECGPFEFADYGEDYW